MAITVVLADDHKGLRQGLRLLLESEADIEIMGEADTGGHAVELVEKLKPDVLLTDLRMPGMDGFELVQHISEDHPGTVTIVLSVSAEDNWVKRALDAGARGYVLKEACYEELAVAIREVKAGRNFISPALGMSPRRV